MSLGSGGSPVNFLDPETCDDILKDLRREGGTLPNFDSDPDTHPPNVGDRGGLRPRYADLTRTDPRQVHLRADGPHTGLHTYCVPPERAGPPSSTPG